MCQTYLSVQIYDMKADHEPYWTLLLTNLFTKNSNQLMQVISIFTFTLYDTVTFIFIFIYTLVVKPIFTNI